MRRCLSVAVVLAVGACLAPLGAKADDILNVGDPAPSLKVSSWVKGVEVEGFEPGKTYVVEFWATWCGPCVASIPHLTELAHQHKDVRFIGVDVWENDLSKVKPFVDEMGDKMDYSVALDAIPAGGKADDGAMAQGWMKAAEENGIPTAFVVRDGTIAWIGHPMSMDEPLARIVAGDWDPQALAKERLAEKVVERKVSAVREKVYTPFRDGDYKATIAAIEEATSGDPDLAKEFGWLKFVALSRGGEVERALELGEALLDTYKENANGLNTIAWNVVDPDLEGKPDPRLARLALRAARRANELTEGEDSAILDTYAVALFQTGEVAEAAEAEQKALKRLEAEGLDPSHPVVQTMRRRVEEYRKAAADAVENP